MAKTYREEVAQMQQERAQAERAEVEWRQNYQREDWEGHLNGIAAEYNESLKLRDEALAEGDEDTAKYYDRNAVRLFTEYNELNPPPPPPPHPDTVELARKNQPYLRKFGERGAKFVDKAHNFWAKRGIGPGHPDYKQRMRDYAEMYGKNHGVPYDPKEEMLTPNEVLDISSGNTKLTAEEHNAALAQALREGKIGKR
jgi:hypothetical protein